MGKDFTLIITEKPSAAKTLSTALFDHAKILTHQKIKYYTAEHKRKKYVIIPAVGHLYNLKHIKRGTPYFELEWKPVFELHKYSAYTKPYLDLFKKFEKKVKDIIIATDYDTEGAVIAHTIIENIYPKIHFKRMKYSSFAKQELSDSFENLVREDKKVITAGITRHYVDYFFGVNISSQLMKAIKKAGRFKIISMGRVQGPTLKIVYLRDKEINEFKSEDYFEIEILLKNLLFTNSHVFDKKIPASKELKQIKKVEVIKVNKGEFKKTPAPPFNLTRLQLSAHNAFGYTPSKTLSIAQKLYEKAIISYPRTSSEKLPNIKHKKLIEKLENQNPKLKSVFTQLNQIKKLNPIIGKKTDPAHPAIHPTGEKKSRLGPNEQKIYTMILKNYLATFLPPAIYERIQTKIKAANQEYTNSQKNLTKKGYLILYPNLQEKNELITFEKGEEHAKFKSELLSKQTQPPSRYSQASLLKILEKNNLGTKATRGGIIKIMFDRGYFIGKSLEVTELGENLAKMLIEHAPTITNIKLTNDLTKDLEAIEHGEQTMEKVLQKSKRQVLKIIKELEQSEDQVGKLLIKALVNDNLIGKCPKCKDDSLFSIRSKMSHKRFVACRNYPKCKTTFPLPQNGLLKTSNEICKTCNHPIVLIITRGKRPWKLCINPDCKSKEEYKKKMEEKNGGKNKKTNLKKAQKV